MAIDRYLQGRAENPEEDRREVVGLDKINLDYFLPQSGLGFPPWAPGKKGKIHRGPQGAFPVSGERGEAERCFSCGNCIQCNVCLMVCPDVAVSFPAEEKKYLIDYDHCKGCGICAVECPRSAMKLEEEKWNE